MRTAARFAPILLAAPLILYLALPTRNYYWDGITFAILAENHAPLRATLHPSHLLYATGGAWLYGAAAALGFKIRALFLLQAVNALLAGAATPLVYRVLRRRGVLAENAIAGALVFAFAATWWRFASDANAYIPAVVLVLCSNDLLETRRSDAAAGLVHATAMLFHELAILFLPVAWLRGRRWSYTAWGLGPVAAAYILSYRIVSGGFHVPEFLSWLAAHSPDAGFSFQPLRDIGLTLSGTLRLIFGGKPGEVTAGPIGLAGAAVIIASAALLGIRLRAAGRPRFFGPKPDVALWLAVYAAFLFFWMPQNTFYRLFYLAPLVLVLWSCVESPVHDPVLPALVCAVVFCWNFVFLIYPQSRIENNVPLRFAMAQSAQWPPGTPIVFHRFHPDLWTISYFNPQVSWIGMDHLDFASLEQGLVWGHERRLPLWLEASAYDYVSADPRGREWLERHRTATEPLVYKDAKHEYRYYRFQ